VTVLTCVPDSESDVQPFSLTLEAFLSDNINLDIISGIRLFQQSVRTSLRKGSKFVTVHELKGPAEGHSWEVSDRDSFTDAGLSDSQRGNNLTCGLSRLFSYRSDRRRMMVELAPMIATIIKDSR